MPFVTEELWQVWNFKWWLLVPISLFFYHSYQQSAPSTISTVLVSGISIQKTGSYGYSLAHHWPSQGFEVYQKISEFAVIGKIRT
jgi:hypothetical protein